MNLSFKIDLSGHVAVVTGGGGVLCARFAEALAACGAAVAVLDINEAAAEAVAARIRAGGGKAVGVAADCLSAESMQAAHRRVTDTLGACTILINGAGGNHPSGTTGEEIFSPAALEAGTSFFDLQPAALQRVMDINMTSAFITTQVFAKDMATAGRGSVINISSMNAFRPLTKIPAYSCAKAAISNFTQWLAVYFSRSGIRVNAIAPGFFVSNQNRALLFNPDGTPSPRAQKILAATPMGRFGEADELIGPLLWLLCEDAAGFVTGTVIPVDGGFSAYAGV